MKLMQLSTTTFVILVSMLFSQALYAHVMVAQHGTLNIAEDGVYMVISLPVSAFAGIDDDKDGKLSVEEFALYRPAIIKTVHRKIILENETGQLALQGIMLSPVTSHHSPKTPATQLVVMGRYTLAEPHSTLEYQVKLFGKGAAEKTFKINATRKVDGKKQIFQLSEKQSTVALFKE